MLLVHHGCQDIEQLESFFHLLYFKRIDDDCVLLALQAQPISPFKNQNEAIKGKKEVIAGGMKEAPTPVKSSTLKLSHTVKKAILTDRSSTKNKSKRRVMHILPWDSLPSNLIKSGKVFN